MWSTDWRISRSIQEDLLFFLNEGSGGHGKGDREKEIDLRGFEVKLTGLDDELVWWWQVELELPVAYANTDVQEPVGYDTLICRRWFRGPVIDFRITCAVEKGETMKIGEIIQQD